MELVNTFQNWTILLHKGSEQGRVILYGEESRLHLYLSARYGSREFHDQVFKEKHSEDEEKEGIMS